MTPEEQIEDRIAKLLALEEGWDSYRGRPIDPMCIERARPFLKLLGEYGMSPWITPLSDGGVLIERAVTDDYQIEFKTDGTAAFCCDGINDHAAMDILMQAANHLPPPKALPELALSREEQVRAEERERCARVAENIAPHFRNPMGEAIAAAIRSAPSSQRGD